MPPASPLQRVLADYPSLLVAYSGGVDSALVAVAARAALGRSRILAAIGISASLPREQLERAVQIAETFDFGLEKVDTGELDDPDYVANRPDRCYFCKRELWVKLTAAARTRGFTAIADGTNADDLVDHRPGMRAAGEFDVRSPLVEAGYSKDDVRREAKAMGIPIWDAPAAPCLSSRVLYGLEVTADRLAQVEQSEAFLRTLGVRGDLRVRHRGTEARIEVAASEFPRIRSHKGVIASRFSALGFERVTLDLCGYRRGSLLRAEEPQVEIVAVGTP